MNIRHIPLYIHIIAIAALITLSGHNVRGQGLAVNTTGATAATSAILDVSSTSKGMLLPSMTSTQRSAIASPATGLLVYQTDGSSGFYYYTGSAWTALNTPGGSAGGDLTGTYPNPTLATTGVAAATYGSTTTSPVITTDTKGRITVASNTTISGVSPGGAAGGNLGGTYPNPSIASLPAISGTNLTNLTAGNLSGTLPAISGANLTSLNASNISSGTIGTAALGSGTASSSTYLSGTGWQAMSGGGGGGTAGYIFSNCYAGTTPYYTGLGNSPPSATRALAQEVISSACTLDAFYVYITIWGGGSSTGTVTGTVYVNGSATSMTVSASIPASATGAVIGSFSDLSHTVSLSTGDMVAILWTNPTAGAPIPFFHWTIHAH